MAHPTKALVLVLLLCAPLLAAAPAGGLTAGSSSAADLKDGIDQFRNGQYDKAILLFHNVLLDPSAGSLKADASLLIAKAYMATGQLDDAGQNLDFYIVSFPAAPDYSEALYQKGRLLFMKDDLESSLQVLQGYLAKYPSSSFAPSAWFWAGESLYGLGRLDDARAVYAKIVKDFPTSIKVEAATYKLELIDIKKKEVELATLLKWSHEELLRNVEDSQNREQSYQQAIDAYQRRLAGAANASLPEDLKTISDLKQQVNQQADQIAQLRSQLAAASSASSSVASSTPAASTAAASADTSALERTLQTKAAALALKEQLLGILGSGAGQ
jgi:TolA-binding protein